MHSLWPFTSCPPAAMLPLRLCRLWPRSPPTRLFAEATRQRSGPSNYYELLGVHPGASPEQIKRAFFSKSKELHPDRDPGNPALHSRFVELSEAYQVLSREQSRRNYDHQLRCTTPPKSPGTTAHPRSAHQTHRKLEQMHRSFMDEKDRIITAIYNDTRARARANRARLQQEQKQRQQLQPPPGPPPGPGTVPPGTSP
ncbi:DnaJ heat shock protein family (Hsp40) member C4 [Rhinolophus ferrumequinum]|uniref:DnaJ homolog subfamily C member 4 n=1 Tax=Rhinolophus ferrumequinum TaxID=59479 RepID=A0A7J7W635_RHIFE|nr:dnaJ homolog subfamily C member 4 isoform X9 [Rhinolophus ferrumequinum]KAF6332917.1 DnaJ heat shock protein family (Hsp40) member C4 [Rhinolophus ferrumequinum]